MSARNNFVIVHLISMRLTLLACRWFFILKVETKVFDAGFLAKSGMQEHLYGHRDVILAGMQIGKQVHHNFA